MIRGRPWRLSERRFDEGVRALDRLVEPDNRAGIGARDDL
jgi:hypothetical protein